MLRLLAASTEADAEALRNVATVLSHELRTPLTTIYSGSKLLRRTDAVAADRTARDIAIAIEVDAERLMRIVEDLVVAAALPGESEVSGEPVLLQRIVPAIARHEEARTPGVALELRVPDHLPAVWGDESYIGQALRNLIANAAEFGPANGSVVVEACEATDSVEVHVLDEGPGVAPADARRLFHLFSRPGTARRNGGLGLGLFVCRRLVELMGGRVWLRRRPVAGSDFGFSLPLYPADER
jgi:two-component system OmpR family sensor kinase